VDGSPNFTALPSPSPMLDYVTFNSESNEYARVVVWCGGIAMPCIVDRRSQFARSLIYVANDLC